jgi:hypothetical protein
VTPAKVGASVTGETEALAVGVAVGELVTPVKVGGSVTGKAGLAVGE